jgi:hypothetical protein
MSARLFRQDLDTGRWLPVGVPLAAAPHLTDEQLPPVGGTAWWTLPRSAGGQPGDLFQIDERCTLALLDRCGPRHAAWLQLVEHTRDHDPAGADDWLAAHEVWTVRRVAGIG